MNVFPRVCPACEQSGLHKVLVVELNEILYVCHECDATWKTKENINHVIYLELDDFDAGRRGYTEFETYLESRDVDWALVKEIILDDE